MTSSVDIASPKSSSEMNLSHLRQETFALTKRLFIQLIRRPSTLMAGVLQPLIWLILFGAFGNSDSNLEKAAHASSFFPRFINVSASLNNWSRALFPLGKF